VARSDATVAEGAEAADDEVGDTMVDDVDDDDDDDDDDSEEEEEEEEEDVVDDALVGFNSSRSSLSRGVMRKATRCGCFATTWTRSQQPTRRQDLSPNSRSESSERRKIPNKRSNTPSCVSTRASSTGARRRPGEAPTPLPEVPSANAFESGAPSTVAIDSTHVRRAASLLI
jgi:hypothetical protein